MTKPPSLSKVWAAWCALVSDQELGAEGSNGHLVLHERLARFSPVHAATPEHIETIRDVLYRGVPLMLAALGWEEPTAGSRGGKNVQTDRARGEQWKLVMAYGGFETVARGLMAFPDKPALEHQDFDALLRHCSLPRFAPIPAPEQKEKVRDKWFASEMLAAPRHPLLAFLGLNNGDAELVFHWLVEGRPIDSWHTALRLTQTLRNVTAHGALSASKTREWKLRPIFQRLTQDLAVVAAAALRTLVVPQVSGAESLTATASRDDGRGRDVTDLAMASYASTVKSEADRR